MTRLEKLQNIKETFQKEADLGYDGNPMTGILLGFEWLWVKLFTK